MHQADLLQKNLFEIRFLVWFYVISNVYLPIRKIDLLTDNKPLSTIPNESFDGPDKQNKPGGQLIGGKAGKKPKSLAHILGHLQIVELNLDQIHEGLEGIRVVGGVVVTGDLLNPGDGYKT